MKSKYKAMWGFDSRDWFITSYYFKLTLTIIS